MNRWAVSMCIAAASAATAAAQPKLAPPVTSTPPPKKAQRQQTAFLGVMAAPSPTRGVFVANVAPDSPAAKSGIHSGEYILTVDGKDVSSPEQLAMLIRGSKPGSEISVVTWRDGKTATRTVTLAARKPAPAAREEGWLGVWLEPDGQQGVRIARVAPGSPAEKAGLKAGRRLLKIDDKPVTTPEDAVRMIGRLTPGTEAKIATGEGTKNQTVSVQIGRRRVDRWRAYRPGPYPRRPFYYYTNPPFTWYYFYTPGYPTPGPYTGPIAPYGYGYRYGYGPYYGRPGGYFGNYGGYFQYYWR